MNNLKSGRSFGVLTSSVPISNASLETTSTAVTATRCLSSSVLLAERFVRVVIFSPSRISAGCERMDAAPPGIMVEPLCESVFKSE